MDQTRYVIASGGQSALVLRLDQLAHRRGTVRHHRWPATMNDVEKLAVEKQQPVLLAGCLTLDEDPRIPAGGCQPRAPQVVDRLDAAGDAGAPAGPVGR